MYDCRGSSKSIGLPALNTFLNSPFMARDGASASTPSDSISFVQNARAAGLAARAMVSAGQLCLRFFANDEALALARKGLQWVEQPPAAESVRLACRHAGMLFEWAWP